MWQPDFSSHDRTCNNTPVSKPIHSLENQIMSVREDTSENNDLNKDNKAKTTK